MDANAAVGQLIAGWHDASAAAFHWNDDPELAQELLAAAIIHGATADRLSDYATVADIYAAYFAEIDGLLGI